MIFRTKRAVRCSDRDHQGREIAIDCNLVVLTLVFSIVLFAVGGCRKSERGIDIGSWLPTIGEPDFHGHIYQITEANSEVTKPNGITQAGPRLTMSEDTYTRDGRPLESGLFGPDGEKTGRTEWHYDDKGRVTREVTSDDADKHTSVTNYSWDEKQKIGRALTERVDQSGKTERTTTEYRYDADEKVIDVRHYHENKKMFDRFVYGYDDKGRETVDTMYYGSGIVTHKEMTSYDSVGRIQSETRISYLEPNRPILSRTVRSYSTNAPKRYTYESRDAKGRLWGTGKTDDHGERVFSRAANSDGAERDANRWEFTYDSVGNWIVRWHYNHGKKGDWWPDQVRYREISYYPAK